MDSWDTILGGEIPVELIERIWDIRQQTLIVEQSRMEDEDFEISTELFAEIETKLAKHRCRNQRAEWVGRSLLQTSIEHHAHKIRAKTANRGPACVNRRRVGRTVPGAIGKTFSNLVANFFKAYSKIMI